MSAHLKWAAASLTPYPRPFDLDSSFAAASAFNAAANLWEKRVFIAKMLTDASYCVAVHVQALVADGTTAQRTGEDNCITSSEAR